MIYLQMEEWRLRGEVACSGLNPNLLTPRLRADLLLRVETEGRLVNAVSTWREYGDYMLAHQGLVPLLLDEGPVRVTLKILTFSK